jgi:hypothetical protein
MFSTGPENNHLRVGKHGTAVRSPQDRVNGSAREILWKLSRYVIQSNRVNTHVHQRFGRAGIQFRISLVNLTGEHVIFDIIPYSLADHLWERLTQVT